MVVRMFVLGALRRGARHGYLLRREAEIDQTDSWAGIKPGSIYAALHSMTDAGLVRVAAVAQDAGPAKTSFEMTSDGRDELVAQTSAALGAAVLPADPFDVGLRLADELDGPDLDSVLTARRDGFQRRIEELRSTYDDVRQYLTVWEARAFDHVIDRMAFELSWTKQLLETLGDG